MEFDPDLYRYPTVAAFGYGVAIVTEGLLEFLLPICLIAIAVTVIVGAWDLLIWLTRSDWRSTEFIVPLYALAVTVALSILFHILVPLQKRITKRLGYEEFDN